MTTGALLFMFGSWAFVLGLTGWSYWRMLRPKEHARRPRRRG